MAKHAAASSSSGSDSSDSDSSSFSGSAGAPVNNQNTGAESAESSDDVAKSDYLLDAQQA
jgi:hypothetical protein